MDDFNNEDLNIDDIFSIIENKKKKINGKKKGNRVELELCKKLTKHFNETFSRSVGSGNRWGQVSNMPEHAKQTLTGDICGPSKFKWVIEVKGGYDDDVDFSSVLENGCSRIDEFIKQSEKDSVISGRLPIIMWKRSRKPWVSMIRQNDLNIELNLSHYMIYNDWIIISLDKMLETTKREFWFND